MKSRIVLTAGAAFLLGAVAAAGIIYSMAPGVMINERTSPLSQEETVERIVASAEEMGWKVPEIHQIHNSVSNGGYDVLPVTVIELCKVDLAGNILSEDENRVVSSMMPCRVAVYENSDGDVIISRMNTGLMSSMFGGDVERIMAQATEETERIIATVDI